MASPEAFSIWYFGLDICRVGWMVMLVVVTVLMLLTPSAVLFGGVYLLDRLSGGTLSGERKKKKRQVTIADEAEQWLRTQPRPL